MINFFIISALAFASVTAIQREESLPGEGCLEYTVDRCDFGQPNSTTNDVPVEFCSLVCNGQPECKFFDYDYKKSQCNHYYTQQNEDFKSYCEESAGPKGVDGSLPINQCRNNPSDPCKGIKRSSCQYNGEIIKTYPQVTDESLCQRFCQALPDCLSYNFGKNSAECQLRTGNDKTCDQVIVEKWVTKEDVDNCWSGHPHSSTSSTTTTEVTTATTTKRCPSADWIFVNNRCYLTSPSKMNWHQAQQFCTEKGGWLAEIFSPDEQSSINGALHRDLSYWIGLTDSANEGHFVWQHSSKPLDWPNWNKGEPNNSSNEDCVFLAYYSAPTWEWNDYQCDNNQWNDAAHPRMDIHALCEYWY